MKNKPFYITTPIYYVNDKPHIGHAYTSVSADMLARFSRLQDRETFFLMGTDEHGQKIEKSARRNNLSPKDFVDTISHKFKDLAKILQISNDDFIRTIDRAVNRVNANLGVIERVRRFSLTANAFTVDNEQMTPTLKVRRHVITEVYRERLEGLYH